MRRAALARGGEQPHDLGVGRDDRGVVRGEHAGVRLVDDPDVGTLQQRAHDRDAVQVQRRVVVGVVLAGPRRRVQHGATAGRGLQDGGDVEVELRAPAHDEVVEVEADQRAPVPLDGGLPRDHDVVVGLGLVGDHGDLVRLAVVDVHVQGALVDQRLEVAPAVVHVDDGLHVDLLVEPAQAVEPEGEQHGQRRHLAQVLGELPVARDDRDRLPLGDALEHGQPLPQLVRLVRGVGEVRHDGVPGHLVHRRRELRGLLADGRGHEALDARPRPQQNPSGELPSAVRERVLLRVDVRHPCLPGGRVLPVADLSIPRLLHGSPRSARGPGRSPL